MNKQMFLDKGFKELGNNSGMYELKIDSNNIIKIYFLQKPWSIPDWLTIELHQGKNRFLKFNGIIDTKEDFDNLFRMLIQRQLNHKSL